MSNDAMKYKVDIKAGYPTFPQHDQSYIEIKIDGGCENGGCEINVLMPWGHEPDTSDVQVIQ